MIIVFSKNSFYDDKKINMNNFEIFIFLTGAIIFVINYAIQITHTISSITTFYDIGIGFLELRYTYFVFVSIYSCLSTN